MNTIIKTIGSIAGAFALAITLSACGGVAPEATTPTSTPSVVVETPATAPTPTEAPTPSMAPIAGDMVRADANGVITLPSGEIADCPADAPSVLVKPDGSYRCQVEISQEAIDIITGQD